MKTLEDYIVKRHVRYMPEEIQLQLKARVPACKGDAAEAMFWVLNGLSDYPTCRACGTKLSSFHWEPFLKKELRQDPEIKQGYRPYCGRNCSYKFGTKQQNYKKSCLERYGVDHPMKTEEVVGKIKKTNILKYGDEFPNKWNGDRFKLLLLNKHGVETVRDIPGVHDKIAETKKKQTLELIKHKIAEIEKLFKVTCISSAENLDIRKIGEIDLEWQHKCGRKWFSNITFRGIRQCPSCSAGTSRGEQALLTFIEGLGFSPVSRCRTIIPPREVDIWIPEKKVAIEFDGTYWHSAKFESSTKCVEKLELCEKEGIHLITVQEHLWAGRQELVQERLRSILGLNKRIYARETQVQRIDAAVAKQFLVEHHLQGSGRSSVQLGLFDGEKLVGVATFGKPRWAKKYDWELIRMAFLKGLTVVGGAAKLIKAFKADHVGSLISYADRCWSTGNVYRQVGFKFLHNTKPSYWWCHHSLGTYARYQTQKKKLAALLGNLGKPFHPELSEEDNMRLAGFLPIYDRGNSAWALD